jgi:hypothetical protein
MWTLSRDDVVTKPGHHIQSEKFMLKVMSNLSGFYVVDRLLNDPKMNRDYFVTNPLIPLEQAIFHRGKAPHQKQLMVHLDNCSGHIKRASTDWLGECGMRPTPDSPTLFAGSGSQ